MRLSERLLSLEGLLRRHRPLWQAQPFKQIRPAWCAEHPQLRDALLALDDEQLTLLGDEPTALWRWLAEYLPEMAGMAELCEIPERVSPSHQEPGPHFANHIPGRKWQQVRAFAAAVVPGKGPFLEWCGGKGHLGRLLAWRHRRPVLTLEYNGQLCADGETLARRSGVGQSYRQLDVLTAEGAKALSGRHAVALHACGELHRSLIREAVQQGLEAVDVAPCCYHHLLPGDYRPMSRVASLVLERDALRLAVTGAVTAPARELRLRDREMAWKLAYLSLLGHEGEAYRALRPIDKAWLQGGLADFCQQLATREGDVLPTGVDWVAQEQIGWQRQRETMRLSLLRQGFRRAIELYLVLDMACYLEEHGYRVELGRFCPMSLTPRDLLLSARLEQAALRQ